MLILSFQNHHKAIVTGFLMLRHGKFARTINTAVNEKLYTS